MNGRPVQSQTLDFTASIDTPATGQLVIFTNTSTGFPANQQYIWNFQEYCGVDTTSGYHPEDCNDTTLGTAVSITHQFAQQGNYLVTCRDENGSQVRVKMIRVQMIGCQTGQSCELVLNGGFEEYVACPSIPANLANNTVCYWSIPNYGTADAFVQDPGCPPATWTVPNNSCGCAQGHLGSNGYAGLHCYLPTGSGFLVPGAITTDYREYIQGTLKTPLTANKTYTVSFWVKLADWSSWAVSGLGAYLSPVPIAQPNNNGLFNFTPQIVSTIVVPATPGLNNWAHISGNFVASGNEQYLIIGNFSDNSLSNATASNFSQCNPAITSLPPTYQTAYYFIDDVSVQEELTVTETIAGDCDNKHQGSITLSVSGALPPFSYLWSNGLTAQNLTGLTAGAYTVTITNNQGCTQVYSYAVPAGNTPANFDILGDHAGCSDSHSYIVDPIDFNLNYTWQTSTGASGQGFFSVYDFQPFGGTGWITFTASDPLTQCSRTVQFDVFPCCTGNPSVLDFSGLTASAVLANSTLYTPHVLPFQSIAPGASTDRHLMPADHIAINGIFIIDTDFEFYLADVVLGPDARILVNAGVKFYINDSYLHTCNHDYMWQGISVQDPTSLISINKNSILEEAKIAVDCKDGAQFLIGNPSSVSGGFPYAVFNANYIGLRLSNYGQQPANSYIASCLFSSEDAGQSLVNLIPPYQNQPAEAGVEIHGSSGLLVGDAFALNPQSGYNIFRHLRGGIRSFNSSFNVYHNYFDQIAGPAGFSKKGLKCGFGIWSEAEDDGSTTYNLTVGSVNPNSIFKNYFTQSTGGIHTSGPINHFIHRNSFPDIWTYGNPAFGTGIEGIRNERVLVEIGENNFQRFLKGIDLRQPDESAITISGNVFNDALFVNLLQPAYAVRIANANPSTVSFVRHITGNLIFIPVDPAASYAARGVVLENMYDVQVDDNNEIIFHYISNPGANTKRSYGVKITGSSSLNSVLSNVIAKNGPDPTVDFDVKLTGVGVETANLNTIGSNLIQRCGSGTYFFNTLRNTVNCNNFNHNFNGVFLLNSDLGDQGTTAEAQDNQWNDMTTVDKDIKSVNAPNSVARDWFVHSTLPPWKSPIIYYNPSTLFNFPSGLQRDCNLPPDNGTSEQQGFAEMVTETGEYSGLDSNETYRNKYFVYQVLSRDSSWMNLGTAYDIILQNFYDSASNTNLEYLRVVCELISSDTLFASALNSVISPANHFEENQQKVNEVYLESWAQYRFDADSNQIQVLLPIALENPLSGGVAVYAARVMLDMDVEDASPGSGNRQSNVNSNSVKQNNISISPNPANGFVHISLSLEYQQKGILEITDALGNRFAVFSVSDLDNNIYWNTSDFNSGVYTCQIIIDHAVAGYKKLVLIK